MQSGLDIHYYLSLAKRRYPYFLIPFILVFIPGISVTILLPPVYQSSATLIVQSQKIPEKLVQSTVASLADERIQIIAQRTMTRANLLRVAEKFSLFSADKGNVSATVVVGSMRKNAKIQQISLGFGKRRRRGRRTVAFVVSFEHRNPALAAKVTSELVTIVQNEDASARISRASETTKFLKREAKRLEKELAAMESRITEYKKKHKHALPEGLQGRIQLLQAAEAQLQQLDRQIRVPGEGGGDVNEGVPLQQLAVLKAQYATKSAIFASNHPEIKGLRRQIFVLEKRMGLAPAKKAKKSAQEVSPPAIKTTGGIGNKPTGYDTASPVLKARYDELEKTIRFLTEIIDQTAEVERALKSMSRGYENKLNEFGQLVRKQQHALMGERLEEDKKSERIELIEQPVTPEVPIKPNRKKILMMALFLAFAAGAGGIFAIETLDQSIRTSADLIEHFDRRPLVAIPYIVTRQELLFRKKQVKFVLIGAGVASVVAVVGMHFLVMPLDEILTKIISRF